MSPNPLYSQEILQQILCTSQGNTHLSLLILLRTEVDGKDPCQFQLEKDCVLDQIVYNIHQYYRWKHLTPKRSQYDSFQDSLLLLFFLLLFCTSVDKRFNNSFDSGKVSLIIVCPSFFYKRQAQQ